MISFQGLPKMARVLAALNPIAEPIKNALLNRSIKFAQLTLCNITDANCPGQVLSSTVSAVWCCSSWIRILWQALNPRCPPNIGWWPRGRPRFDCCPASWLAGLILFQAACFLIRGSLQDAGRGRGLPLTVIQGNRFYTWRASIAWAYRYLPNRTWLPCWRPLRKEPLFGGLFPATCAPNRHL